MIGRRSHYAVLRKLDFHDSRQFLHENNVVCNKCMSNDKQFSTYILMFQVCITSSWTRWRVAIFLLIVFERIYL